MTHCEAFLLAPLFGETIRNPKPINGNKGLRVSIWNSVSRRSRNRAADAQWFRSLSETEPQKETSNTLKYNGSFGFRMVSPERTSKGE